MKPSICVALLVVLVSSLHADERLPIFVRTFANPEGFSDPSKDRQDSLKDIQKRVLDSKVITLANSERTAVAVIEVLDRSTRREVNGWTALNGQAQNKSSVIVRLTAGTYSTEFTGESGSKGVATGYGDAAKKVVRQVEAWVVANRARLTAIR